MEASVIFKIKFKFIIFPFFFTMKVWDHFMRIDQKKAIYSLICWGKRKQLYVTGKEKEQKSPASFSPQISIGTEELSVQMHKIP